MVTVEGQLDDMLAIAQPGLSGHGAWLIASAA